MHAPLNFQRISRFPGSGAAVRSANPTLSGRLGRACCWPRRGGILALTDTGVFDNLLHGQILIDRRLWEPRSSTMVPEHTMSSSSLAPTPSVRGGVGGGEMKGSQSPTMSIVSFSNLSESKRTRPVSARPAPASKRSPGAWEGSKGGTLRSSTRRLRMR